MPPLVLCFFNNENNSVLIFSFFEVGELVYQTTKKRESGPPVTGKRIQGISYFPFSGFLKLRFFWLKFFNDRIILWNVDTLWYMWFRKWWFDHANNVFVIAFA